MITAHKYCTVVCCLGNRLHISSIPPWGWFHMQIDAFISQILATAAAKNITLTMVQHISHPMYLYPL